MDVAEMVVSGAGGTPLHVRFVRGCGHRTSGCGCPTVVLLHGVCEHSGRYQHVAEKLSRERWNVVLFDQRGHGRSGGTPTHVERFELYLDDLDRLFDLFCPCAANVLLCGHSFGGLVAIRYAQTRPRRLGLLTLLSPLLRVKVRIDPFTYRLGRLLLRLAPRTRFRSRVPRHLLTHCPRRQAERDQDQLIHRSVTVGWFFQMEQALAAAWDEADKLTHPLLICQAADDAIVDPAAAQPFLQAVGSRDKTLKLYPGLYHELVNEVQWERVVDDWVDWASDRFFRARHLNRRCA